MFRYNHSIKLTDENKIIDFYFCNSFLISILNLRLWQVRSEEGENWVTNFPCQKFFLNLLRFQKKKITKILPSKVFSYKKFENPPSKNFWPPPWTLSIYSKNTKHSILKLLNFHYFSSQWLYYLSSKIYLN